MSRSAVAGAFLLLAWLGVPLVAQADGIVVEPIRFARGAWRVTISGAVIRGERSLYSVDAKAGQRLTVNVSAVENNAVFQLYAPGAHPEQRDYGVAVVGKALVGAAEGDDATKWTGVLQQNGAYFVAVGPLRGNATYSLTVAIH